MATERLGDSALLVRDRNNPTWFRLVMVVRRGFFPWPTVNLSAKAIGFARDFFQNAAGTVGAIPVAPGTADGAVVVIDMRASATQSVAELKRRIDRAFSGWDVTADNMEVFRLTTGDLDAVRSPQQRQEIAESVEEEEASNRLPGRVAGALRVGLGTARMILVGAFLIAAAVVLLPLIRPKLFGKLLEKVPAGR